MQNTIKTRAHVAMLMAACTACLALVPAAHARPAEETAEGGKVNVEVAQRTDLRSIFVGPSGTWYAKDFWGRWYQSTDQGQTWQRM